MPIIEIVFSNNSCEDSSVGTSHTSLFFKVFETSPAKKWLRYLEHEIATRAPIDMHYLRSKKVHGRFIGFEGFEKTESELAELINQCIRTVNEYSPGSIPIVATDSADQHQLNELHTYFETLRGPRLDPVEIFLHGPESVKAALEDFNLFIHEYESKIQNTALDDGNCARLGITFSGERIRHPMSFEDFSYFELHRDFGGLYLHYCDVGKPVLDVFEDQDDLIGIDNIRPLELISSDFDVYFGESDKKKYDMSYKIRLINWLNSIGLDHLDPRLSMGYLKVGQLIMDNRLKSKSRQEILGLLSTCLNVGSIMIHE